MSATEFDDVSNKTIAAHLGRQDSAMLDLAARVGELHALLQDSVTDRRDLRQKIEEINAERARLAHEGAVERRGIEERIAAVEARGDLADVRALLAELAAANTLQLSLHRWWTAHKVRSKLLALIALGSVPVLSQLIGILFHHLGWS